MLDKLVFPGGVEAPVEAVAPSLSDPTAMPEGIDLVLVRISHIEARMDELEEENRRLRSEVGGTVPSSPGIAMRMDRIERDLQQVRSMSSWLLGGGGLGMVTLLIMVWKGLAYFARLSEVTK